MNNPAYRHGHTKGRKFSSTYHSWASMIQRCTNPNRSNWVYYGGKGVKVCKRWYKFENFLADMGVRPLGFTLDRKKVTGNYCKSNCRWATQVTQARNSVQVVWVLLRGERKRLVEWCEELGISVNTVRDRVKFYGYTYQEALLKDVHWKPKRLK